MSQMEAVRQPVSVGAQSRRRLDERLGLRFPRALALIARLVWRLPADSQLRQAWVRRAAQRGCEASNRGDFEANFVLWHPRVETIWDSQIVGLGWEPVTHGREARLDAQRRWIDEWGRFRFEPDEVIDLGDRMLVVGRMRGSGGRSGAPIDNAWALLLTLSAGRVIREQPFMDHAEAFKAAGLLGATVSAGA